jgi:PleD family two-component response regulator
MAYSFIAFYKNMMGELITNYRLLKQMEEQITARTKNLETALEEIKQLKEHHESMSRLDELTGSYNRRYFFMRKLNWPWLERNATPSLFAC